MSVTIVRTGLGNTASLMAAFARLEVETVLTDEPEVVRNADRVVLPGVGAFGPAMATLRAKGLALAVQERVATGRPLLGICLGLQLLTRQSAEAPGVAGLGVLEADVVPFGGGVRVPHLGWNRVTPEATATLLGPGDACFANSYHLDRVPQGMSGAYSEHGVPFVAAVERGSLLGCQFHPELSGRYGADLLRAWVSRC